MESMAPHVHMHTFHMHVTEEDMVLVVVFLENTVRHFLSLLRDAWGMPNAGIILNIQIHHRTGGFGACGHGHPQC